MTATRFAVQAVFLSLQIYNDLFQVFATTIKVPSPGFQKKSLEFIHVSRSLQWAKAAHVCSRDYQGTLVRINEVEERDALLTFVEAHSVGNHFWIGLQWSNGEKLWNDGTCTQVTTDWYHYKDGNSEAFDSSAQCFAAHDLGKLEWEAFGCQDAKHFVCERRTVINTVDENIDFHVVQYNNSDHASCASLCQTLEDCFISSAIVSACIVGLASASPNTRIIVVGGKATGQTVTTANSNAQALNVPPNCVVAGNGDGDGSKTLEDYTLLDGNWQESHVNATPPQCPSSAPLVSYVYVTATVTETSVQVDTTTSPVEVNTCSQASGASNVIVPTTVTHVMTTVAMETTTVPTYVTVTAQISGSACVESSVVLTTTVNSCSVDGTSAVFSTSAIPSGVAGQSSESAGSANVEITERLRSEIYDSLYVNKDELSKTIRAKNSATNKLTSSVAIGFSFSLIGVIFIAVIILSDMRAIFTHVKTRMCVNLRSLSRSY